jgi:hypothetical protein
MLNEVKHPYALDGEGLGHSDYTDRKVGSTGTRSASVPLPRGNEWPLTGYPGP